jgi:hypothetical protein
MQCSNNVRQLCVALTSFHTANNAFPPGLPSCMNTTQSANYPYVGGIGSSTPAACTCCGPNWEVAILPFMEEQAIYTNLLTCLDSNAPPNSGGSFNACSTCGVNGTNSGNSVTWIGVGLSNTGTPIIPAPYVCPDGGDNLTPFTGAGMTGGIAKGNYAANWGAGTWNPLATTTYIGTYGGIFDVAALPLTSNNGVQVGRGKLGSRLGVRMEDILDGASNTMMVSEVVGIASATDMRGAWTWAAMGASAFSTGATITNSNGVITATNVHVPNTSLKDDLPNIDNTVIQTTSPLQATQDSTANNWVAAARSNHSANFVNVGFADGSVHKFNDTTDPTVWAGMATRAGHENTQITP